MEMSCWILLVALVLFIVVLFALRDLGRRTGIFGALNEFATMYNEQYDLNAEEEDERVKEKRL
jgi:hypothetical protein